MSTFTYQVRDAQGAVRDGSLEAGSVTEASQILRARGEYLLNVAPLQAGVSDVISRIRNFSIEFGPGLKDILTFTNQLSVMIRAGINIRNAIEGIGEQVQNQKFRRIIFQIKNDVESGVPLSEALAKHPKAFSPLYINMVRASELSGNLAHMLHRISTYLEQQVETRSMIRAAMIYPCIIGSMAVVTTVFLLTFVLPRFMKIFEGKEEILPLPTKMLLATSTFLRGYWYLVLLGIAGMIWGFCFLIHTKQGHLYWDSLKLRMPLFKRMFRALYISRGLHTMGELVNAGVPMLDTLRITAQVSGNEVYKSMWLRVYHEVKQGQKIAKPLQESGQMPPNVVQMIGAGEESGNLGEVMGEISAFYSNELRSTIKAVTSMIEPLMIVVMGFLVGFIAMSVILPIFKMSSLVG